MSLQGGFFRYPSPSLKGIICYTFLLKNTSMYYTESFDLVVCDAMGQNPWYLRDRELGPGEEMHINRDNLPGWYWCQGDFCATLDEDDCIDDQWVLNIPDYGPGECPECHGTHKCAYCRGQGNIRVAEFSYRQCPQCGGTGICQTCYIPERPYRSRQNGTVGGAYGSDTARRNQYAANNIRTRISDLQAQVQDLDWNLKMMQLDGRDVTNNMAYTSILQLKYRLSQEIIELQSQLQNYM